MIILFLMLIAMSNVCFGAEEAFQKFLETGAKLTKTAELINYYLVAGRAFLRKRLGIDLIVASHNLKLYEYGYDRNANDLISKHNRLQDIASIKVQIVDDGKIAIFWRSKSTKLSKPAYFHCDGMMYNFDVLDIAVSHDGKYYAALDENMGLPVLPNNKENLMLLPTILFQQSQGRRRDKKKTKNRKAKG